MGVGNGAAVMLELRPNCARCGIALPADSPNAWICSLECTYCGDCRNGVLDRTCPNCGGELQRRPTRARQLLQRYPASTLRVLNEATCSGPAAASDIDDQ